MADSLSTGFCDASDVKCIHFKDLVKKMGPKGYTPKCVDSMAVSGNRAYLIEFKPIPGTGGDDMSDSLQVDSASLMLFSISGFDEELVEYAEDNAIALVSMDELMENRPAPALRGG